MRIVDGVLKEVSKKDIIDGVITVPEGVRRIASAVFRGWKASAIILPDSITTVGEAAFAGCTSLTSLPDSITTVGEAAFAGCTSLTSLPDSITTVEFGAFKDCTSLTSLPDSITTVGHYAFKGCTSLTSLPDSITTVGDHAFAGCTSLTSLPDSITTVGRYAFENCTSLTSLPDSITTVREAAFADCTSLTSLPDSITTVGDWAFSGCTSLTSLPDSITTVGHYAFKGCTSLTSLPDSITTVGGYAFRGCTSLTNIPNSITTAGEKIFEGCTSLTSLPNNITRVRNKIFKGCTSLTSLSDSITEVEDKAFEGCTSSINTPWGMMDLKEEEKGDTRVIVTNYLYLYANSILKEKYHSLNEFLSNSNINQLMNSQMIYGWKAISKFKNLFYKMRKNYDIETELFSRLSLKSTEQFNLNTWNQIQSTFYSSGVLKDNTEMAEALVEMIEVFGLFEQDSNKDARVQNFQKFILNKPYRLVTAQYQRLPLRDNCFQKVNSPCFILKPNVQIPKEFLPYLKTSLSEEKMKKIKKLSGTYGKQINDFVKEYYIITYVEEYELKEEYYDDKDICKILFKHDLIGHVNYSSLHRMFDGCQKEFNAEFYQFFIENLPFILDDEKLQSNIKNIQKKFDRIQKHYKTQAGIEKITLKQVLDYLENVIFNYHDGNYELSLEVKKAGVVSQEAFDYYQEVFEKNNSRHLSSLVKRSNIYEVNGYTIKAELLRRDDPFAMLVGETNYTNCCQVYGGIGHNCMAHAVSSSDGGIFVTRLLQDGEWILLTQSWDWQNNNLYCHDNIEATSYFENSPASLKEAVAKVLELDGKYIIEKSKKEVENYIQARKKTVEKSLSINKEKELRELQKLQEREVIRLVTTGSGNDDLGLSNYFSSSIQVNQNYFIAGKKSTLSNFQPVNYNSTQVYFDKEKTAYTDSMSTQYVIAGSIEDLCLAKIEPLVPIYRDPRRVILEQDKDIHNYTTKKVKYIEKNSFPKDMLTHQDSSQADFSDSNIYLGEDWYLIYEERANNVIYISDLAKVEPSLEDEKGKQNQEIMNVIYNLTQQYDQVEADLKEDTSYLLYLMNKQLHYFEQVGEDISYPFDNPSNKKIVSELEQQQILKNARSIKEKKNPERIMHKVTFRKGRLLRQEKTGKKR